MKWSISALGQQRKPEDRQMIHREKIRSVVILMENNRGFGEQGF